MSSYVMGEHQSRADHIGIYKDTCKRVNSWSGLGTSTTAGFGCHSGNIMQQIPKTMIDINQEWASHRNAQNPKATIKLQQKHMDRT